MPLKMEIDNSSCYPPILIPTKVTWDNYVQVMRSNRFVQYFFNSLIVTDRRPCWTAGQAMPAGTVRISRMKESDESGVRGAGFARMTPGLSYLIPLFLLFQWLGLMGTLVPQILIHLGHHRADP